MKRLISISLVAAVLSAGLVAYAVCAEEETKTEVLTKETVGSISAISKNFISVEYAADEKGAYEMAFNLDNDVRFERKKQKDLVTGDIVAVVYDETSETKKGEKPRVVKRQVKTVEFRQPAPQTAPEETSAAENKE